MYMLYQLCSVQPTVIRPVLSCATLTLFRSRAATGGRSRAWEEAVMATCPADTLLCMLPAILPGTSLVDRLSLPRPVPACRKGLSAVHIF